MPSAAPRTSELARRLAVLPAILRAAVRVGWHEPGSTLPALARRLRDTGPAEGRLDPGAVLPVIEALLPVLPPVGAGRCVKRSLLLLDLWSRAGLEPELHLGYRMKHRRPSGGHAWVTTPGGLSTFRPPDVAEVWRG